MIMTAPYPHLRPRVPPPPPPPAHRTSSRPFFRSGEKCDDFPPSAGCLSWLSFFVCLFVFSPVIRLVTTHAQIRYFRAHTYQWCYLVSVRL